MQNTEQNKIRTHRVAITGIGIISALGNSVETNKKALFSSKSGIRKISHIPTVHAESIMVGEVDLSNDELIKNLNIPDENNFSRTALLGVHAAKEAIENANITDINKYKTGLISATTVGGMDQTENHLKQFRTDKDVQKYILSHHAADSTQKIADTLGITGFTTTISTACSSAANAIMLGSRLIESGKLQRVIVGGTDALSRFTINGFKSLMLQSNEVCKPFDAYRNGLNLGEAAAYLVLESETIAQQENKTVLGYVSGFGNTNDAFHQTASSDDGEGAFLAMTKALGKANLKPQDIDYINAHGTATPNNDLSESVALKRIFDKKMPEFSSTKAFTGHTLAAAGAVEAVFSVFALQEQVALPNLNFETAIPETGLVPTSELKHKKIDHVLSNSFGFGGNCSSLIFSKV